MDRQGETAVPVDVALLALSKALVDTANAHEQAAKDERIARSRESVALNDMNKAQRDFDAFVAKLKQNAPRESEWKRPAGVLVRE